MSPIDAFYAILCSLFGLTWPFLFCFYSNRIIDRISDIGTTTYDLNWFNFPTHLQKYITLIVARSQQPIYFTGLGLIYCTIENFGMVSIYISFFTSSNSLRINRFKSFKINMPILSLQLLKSSCSYYLIFRSFSQE